MKDGRLFKSVRNIVWRFIVLGITMVANLIIPRYIIEIYGSEVNGLTSTIAYVLTVVNLIQAGLGSSVTFLMYKPIGDNDRVQLASIIKSAKRVYRYISLGIAIIGLISSAVLAFVIDSNIARSYIFIACLVTCIDSAMSTYFTAAGNVFLGAKQDGYIVSRVTIIANIVGYVLKFLIIFLKPHFMWLYVVNVVICLTNIIGLSISFAKRYEPFKPQADEIERVKRVPIPGVSCAAANEISHSIVTSLLSITISAVCGLKAASVVSVYLMVVNCIMTFSSAIYGAIVPSYGSVAAEENMEKTNTIFEIYQFTLFSITTFLHMCMAFLLVPFVSLYTKGVTDINYVNPMLMVLLVIYCIFYVARIPYNNTVYIRGLFKETYKQPVLCAIIAIVIMLLMERIEYTYAVVGLIFFYVVNTLYQHYKLKKLFNGFQNNHFWRHLLVSITGCGVSIAMSFVLHIEVDNFFQWAGYGCVTAVVCVCFLALLIALFDRRSFATTVNYFVQRKQK